MARQRKGLTIGKTRSALYFMAKILGDVSAVTSGKILRRILRRMAGKAVSRSLFRW